MRDEAQTTPCYRVSGLSVDLGTCELTHNGTTIALPKLSFDLLASLIRNAPNVVTIDRLIDEVWDGRIVAEETVTQRVKLLRDALAEAGYSKNLVTTVRGRGYRLAAPVEQVDRAAERTRGGTTYAITVAAIVSVLAVVALLTAHFWSNTRAIDDKSIAVLPFENFSEDRDLSYVGDGLAEELLNRFAEIPGLHVASRTSSFTFREPSEDIGSIAEQLGVRTVLEGSVRESQGRIRITVQLIDALRDRHLWSETFDRDLVDVLDVQDDVAAAVIERFRLTPRTDLAPGKQPNPDVVDLYLRGRHELRARTATSLEAAVTLFEQTIDIDPNYAPAHAALATAYIDLARRGNFAIDQAEQRASQAVRTALELDPQLAEAHATLGLLRLSTGDSETAEAALRHAIELNPNLAEATLYLAHTLRGTGRLEEGRQLLRRTLLLDPLNVGALDALAFDLMADGDYDGVIRQFERRLRIEDRDGESYRLMAMTARTFGRLDSAVRWARAAVAADPDGPLNTNELVMAYSAIGELELAGRLADDAYQAAPDNHWVALLRAFTFINSGEFDALEDFAEQQLELVTAPDDALLKQGDRIRLAIAGLSASYRGDYAGAERRLYQALGEPLTSVLEPQFTIGLLGALAYAYDHNGKETSAAETLDVMLGLIADQRGWINQHLIYADSIAAAQLMRGERDAAIATLRQAIADGWIPHRGFLYGALWRDFHAEDAEFRSLMEDLYSRVEVMRNALSKPSDAV